jgi:hypothetical protein
LKNSILIECLRKAVLGFGAAALLSVSPTPLAAQFLYGCRDYPPRGVVQEIKLRVDALRSVERETADRLVGLDTRPYDWLVEQARKAQSEIAVPALMEAEKSLDRCRNYIRPLRAYCAGAGLALIRVIEEIIAAEAKKVDPKDDKKDDAKNDGKNPGNEARKAFAETVPYCERALSLTPLDTTLRHFD